ncbi:MAG: hypothetical protein ACLR7S_15180 [Dorea longicatena]
MEDTQDEQEKGEGLKSFNKGFSVPDTYIIIFFVVVLAAIVTFFVPKGYYETQDVTYMMNGVEKTRTVIKDGSFQYLTDDAGKAVTEGVALFSGDGESGFFNYMFNGIVSDSAIQIIAFLLVVGGAFGIMIRTGAIEAGLVGLIRKAKGAEKLLIPVLLYCFLLAGLFLEWERKHFVHHDLCPLFVAVGYDTVIAVLVTYVATQIGFGASWMNPFSVESHRNRRYRCVFRCRIPYGDVGGIYSTRLRNDHVLCGKSKKDTNNFCCI